MSGPARGSLDRLAEQAADAVDRAARARALRAPSVDAIALRARRRRGRSRLAGATLAVVGVLVVGGALLARGGEPSVRLGGTAPDRNEQVEAGDDRAAPLRWWNRDIGAGGVSPGGSFVVANEEAVFAVGGGGYGYVNAVLLDDGSLRWRVQVDERGGVHLQVATDELVVANPQYEQLVALAADDGERVWTFTGDDEYGFVSSVVHDDLLVAVAGTPEGHDRRPPRVYGVGLASGEQRWEAVLGAGESPQCMSPVVAGEHVLVSTVPDGEPGRSTVYALDMSSGQRRWATEVGAPLDVPVCMEDGLHVTDGHVHVPLPGPSETGEGTATLDLAGGQQRWTARARPVGARGRHLVLRGRQRLYTVDPATGDVTAAGVELHLGDGELGRGIDAAGHAVTLHRDRVLFVDPVTAAIEREVALPAPANEVIVTGTTLVVGTQDRGVLALDLDRVP